MYYIADDMVCIVKAKESGVNLARFFRLVARQTKINLKFITE